MSQKSPAAGLDKRTAQRLRKGKLPVEGRLDLHGLPHKNFVHLKGTHKVGALELVVEEAVDWQPGEELVLMNPWEEVRFASIFLDCF